MKNDYLWDGSGEPDPEIQRIEKSLAQFRYAGEAPMGGRPFAAYFEAHIEQGPILEDTGTISFFRTGRALEFAAGRGRRTGRSAGSFGIVAAGSYLGGFERAGMGRCAAIRGAASRAIRTGQ